MTDISSDDIAALFAQGDLGAILRLQEAPPAPPEPVARQKPGAWPTGTRPPDPIPPVPADVVAAAVAEYRAWHAAGEPDGNYRCDCEPCRLLTGPA